MGVDNSKSMGIIDPNAYTKDIHIIGAGATGGSVAMRLIDLGFQGQQIIVHDFDKVEGHNLNNQVFALPDVGKLKTEALKDIIKRDYGEEVIISSSPATAKTKLSGTVFMLVDTFSARGDIFKGMEMNPKINVMIETRLGARHAIVNSINPCDSHHTEYFKSILYEDDEEGVEKSLCGTAQTISPTANVLSGMAVWEFINYVNKGRIGKHVYLSLDPFAVIEDDISKLTF